MIHKITVKRGFSMMELVIAVGIFLMVIVAVTSIFGKQVRSYQRNKIIQRDMESAQQALNYVTKVLRTSTLLTGSLANTLRVYDYSQSPNNCILLDFRNNKISYARRAGVANDITCSTVLWPAAGETDLTSTSQAIATNFYLDINPTTTNYSGLLTISFDVCPPLPIGCSTSDKIRIQTTVSLRDYEKAI